MSYLTLEVKTEAEDFSEGPPAQQTWVRLTLGKQTVRMRPDTAEEVARMLWDAGEYVSGTRDAWPGGGKNMVFLT